MAAGKSKIRSFLEELKSRAYVILGLVILIWIIELANMLLGHRLSVFGILPRHLAGIPGIFLSPLLHHGWGHVMANTIPLAALGALILLEDIETFVKVTAFVVVVCGALVWMLGRSAYHVGASGLVMGYFGFLLARGWAERSLTAIVLAGAAVLIYGGMLWNVLPGTPGVSWEMHLFGFGAGVLAAWFFSKSKKNGKSA